VDAFWDPRGLLLGRDEDALSAGKPVRTSMFSLIEFAQITGSALVARKGWG
jgi:hypothetical protein